MSVIKSFIESQKISQAEFSRKTGIDKFQVSKLVNGVLALNKLNADKIKSAYPLFIYNVEQLPEFKEDPNGKEIPFYNQEVYGTISPVLDDYVTMQPYAIKKIPMFTSADGAVQEQKLLLK